MWLGALVLLAVVCFGLAALFGQREQTRIQEAVVPLDDPLANWNQVGVNVELEQYSASALDDVLAHISEGGFDWVRQRFSWREIEPQRGVYNWAAWDAMVEVCRAHDLRLIAVLDDAPGWAHPQAGPGASAETTPPQEVAEWGAFVGAVAERYRGRIAAYQVWHEPNLAAHWGGQYVDPVAYLGLLREGAVRIRTADPGAVVVAAALAPTLETGPLNLNEVDYLRQLVQAGGRPYLDVLAVQPYGFAAAADAEVDAEQNALNFQRAATLRREMVRLGLADTPIWATAWGWNAFSGGASGGPSPWPAVDEARRAAYTVQALELARREWPWMGPMIVYTYQPDRRADQVGEDAPRWGFALVDEEGKAGQTWQALEAYNRSPQPLHTGVYRAGPDVAAFEGDWRFSDAGADPPHGADAGAHNATLHFDVVGSTLDLSVRRGDYWAVLYVSIDGGPANGLPRDEKGRAYLVLYDPAGKAEDVTVAHGLDPRVPHQVAIVAHQGWGQWPLFGWTVRGPDALPLASARGNAASLTLGGALALLAAGALVWATPKLRQPLYDGVGRTFRGYRGLPEPLPILATLAAAAGFYFVPWTPVALLFLALWSVLAFLRIDLGLATVALALPLYTRPKVLLGRPISVVELSLALCGVVWAAARLLDWGRRTGRAGRSTGEAGLPPLLRVQQWLAQARTWPARLLQPSVALDAGVVLLVLVALSSVEGWAPLDAAQREWRTLFFEGALYYALIRLAVRSPRAQRRVAEGWLLGAAGIAAVGLGQWLLGQDLIAAEGTWRVRGFFGSPNNLALYLGRALPVLLAVAWLGPTVDRGGKARRWVYAFVALGVLGALLLTRSRGAMLIALPAALLALGLLQRNRRALWVSLAALVVLALLLLGLGQGARILALLRRPAQGTGFFRLKLWRSTLTMIADHPLRGVGLDGFLYAYRSRYVLPSAWGELNLSHPHNLVLDAWTRLGFAGLLVVGWLLYWFCRIAWAQFKTALGYRRALLLGAMAAMVALVGHGMVDQALFTFDLGFVVMVLLALVQG